MPQFVLPENQRYEKEKQVTVRRYWIDLTEQLLREGHLPLTGKWISLRMKKVPKNE